MRLKIFLMGITMISLTVFSNVGAARIENLNSFTIEEALTYSMEEELLANAECEKIIEKYGVKYPEIPSTAMYDKFLEKKLPKDIEEVFMRLKNASENHLRAFRRQKFLS